MDYSTLHYTTPTDQEPDRMNLHTLYEVCRQIVDGRSARGKRYDLAGLLVLVVLAKLAGMTSLVAASEWVVDQEER